jgi:serine/threonine protein phosphatase PrpC
MADAPAAPPAAGIGLDVAQVSGIGGRDSNQDALGSLRLGGLVCFVVSDGAGGHEGGEIASRTVVQAVSAAFEEAVTNGGGIGAATLQACIARAMAAVAQARAGNAQLESMNATVAILQVDTRRGEAAWAHLGDTRIYLFRGGRLLHMTKDHSLVQQFIDAGLVDGADLRTHPKRNLLYAAIGAENDVPAAIQAPIALEDGDAVLVCTDGLWEWVSEDAMEEALSATGSAQAWLDALCAAAEHNGAQSATMRDNFTAQVVLVHNATGQGVP